ncbi:DENN domain-containing protein 1B isoform X10 [Sitodiplosis mosellana]|uniref:DENN domain-containing protein 1B isoform X10 n=1 Tax=Sitodiplosis mosellana TaxID=263140 RepID=UPI002444B581|nr:DENN domain-containing protein 1B isoform X10 [Sitodiplosis mosellana]
MNTRFKENVQKLFEYWCEISPTAIGEKVSGVIVESFPERFKDTEIITKIPEFAYPCQFLNESVQTYSFVLTSSDSKWRFGFCRHDAKAQTAMVIITYLPWHDTFLKFLNVLGELKRTSKNDFQPFLAEAYAKGVPEPGACLRLFYNSGLSSFDFQRPSQFQLPSIPENHNLNLYYNFVDPKNMIAVFAAMLAERRLVFTSQRLDRLSSSVQAAHAFLYPMVWQHIFIPILPLKMKEILCAPMPYLIGVPEAVLETMTREELGEVVILNCDNKYFESPFDDVKNMPAELVSQLKKQLSNQHDHIGDRVSKIFLGVLVQLIGGYRDAIKFSQGAKLTWCRETFIDSRPSHLRPFLRDMLELQIFQQFIEERLEMLNTGLGFSDEFELETLRHHEKPRQRIKPFLRNVKDKTNPAVKSAVQSVKQGGRGMKTAYKGLKSKLSDRTPSKESSSRSGSVASAPLASGCRSEPNSPLKPVNSTENRRSSRSGSLVNTPDHQAKSSTIPPGTLFPLDDVGESSPYLEARNDSSASNSTCSFDAPPDVLPPVPPRITNPPPRNNRNATSEHLIIIDTDDQVDPAPVPAARNRTKTATQPPPPPLPPHNSVAKAPANNRNGFENNFVQNTNSLNLRINNIIINRTESLIEPSPKPPPLPPQNYKLNMTNETKTSEVNSDVPADLIELNSREESFEVDDFDPLNQNAKQIPTVPKRSPVVLPPVLSSVPKGASPNSSNAAFSNPMYPYFVPSYLQKKANTAPVTNAVNNTKIDDDVELLRKYGLDQFKLIERNSRTSTSSNDTAPHPFRMGSGNQHTNRTSETFRDNGLQTNGDIHRPKSNNNWTTFD